jgi:hypothetical protein
LYSLGAAAWQFKKLSLCLTAVIQNPKAVYEEEPELVKFVEDYGKFLFPLH